MLRTSEMSGLSAERRVRLAWVPCVEGAVACGWGVSMSLTKLIELNYHCIGDTKKILTPLG